MKTSAKKSPAPVGPYPVPAGPREPATTEQVKALIREQLNGDLESAGADVLRFRNKLNVGTTVAESAYAVEDALRWADGVFDSAARVRVYQQALAVLDHENGGIEALRRQAREAALSGARSRSRSTSVCANLVEDARTAAWAVVFETVENRIAAGRAYGWAGEPARAEEV